MEHCDTADEARFCTADGGQKNIAAYLQIDTAGEGLSDTAVFVQFDTVDVEQ